MPIYRVTDTATGTETFVDARRIEQAIRHVVGNRFVAEMLSVERFEPEPIVRDTPDDTIPIHQNTNGDHSVAPTPPFEDEPTEHDIDDAYRALA